MQRQALRLFKTLPHDCGYFPDRQASNVVLAPGAGSHRQQYAQALTQGFRRAGKHVYRPNCEHCNACVPSRIRVAAFRPDRSQRRCLKRNADLDLQAAQPGLTVERHDLYRRYLHHRHPNGGMDPANPGDFNTFLDAAWSPTVFLEARRDDQLLMVAATDVCATGLSAVYTFFDPDEKARSLGTWAILQQVELARRRNLQHVYLGYWIAGHPKMDYKARFAGVELRMDGRWQAAEDVIS